MSQLLKEYIQRVIIERGEIGVVDNSCRYEATVIKTLRSLGIAGHIKRAACSDSLRPDADIKIDGDIFFVEIKSNGRAQMGGGSIGYSSIDKRFFAAGHNRELSDTIAALLNDINDSSLHRGLSELMDYLSRISRLEIPITDVPMSGFTPKAWERAVRRGMLLPINRMLEGNTTVISNHYARKQTYYVQIGGAGLFRLGEANPADLPVPVLNGKVQLEVRVAKSGNPTAGLRVQARLLAKNTSPFTLDDPESIKKMLGDRLPQKKKDMR